MSSLLARLESPRARRRLGWALGIVAVVALAAAVAAQWRELPDFDWRFAPGWLLASVVALAGMQAAHAELWIVMVRRLGSSIRPVAGRAVWNLSILGRYVPTGAVMAAGRMAMAARHGVSGRVTAVSVVYELALTMVCTLLLGMVFLMQLPGVEDSPARWGLLALPVLALAALDPALLPRGVEPLLRRLGRPGLDVYLDRRELAGFLVAYAVTFALGGLGVWAFAEAIYDVRVSDIPAVVGAYGMGVVAAALAFVIPGGIGAREAGLAAGLTLAMPFTVAVAVAAGSRLAQIAIELGLAGATAALARRAGAPVGAAGAPAGAGGAPQ